MLKKVFNKKLLLVEDDPAVVEKIKDYFDRQGNTVYCTGTVAGACSALANERFDAIILDLMLPDGDGTDIIADRNDLPPVIILSTLSDESSVLGGFESGATDYVVKPCSPRMLEARLALRLAPTDKATLSLAGLTMNTAERVVYYDGKAVPLTSSEFNILYFLMTHPDTFFDSEAIYRQVWDAPGLQTTTVRYHISNLRRKIKEITQKNLIITEFGKGYAFVGRN